MDTFDMLSIADAIPSDRRSDAVNAPRMSRSHVHEHAKWWLPA
jgi:hypothetical protein